MALSYTFVAALLLSQVYMGSCFSNGFIAKSALMQDRQASSSTSTGLQVCMQARDKYVQARSMLAATAFNRQTQRRAQTATNVATISSPMTQKTKKSPTPSWFARTKLVRTAEEAQAPESGSHVEIARVQELSSLLSQYARTLNKMKTKMVSSLLRVLCRVGLTGVQDADAGKRAALSRKFVELSALFREGSEVLSVLQSDCALRAAASLRAKWQQEAKEEAARALQKARAFRRRQRSVADDMFLECVHVLESVNPHA
eukprot:CAMPEP_0202852934 /NCGR_PEP_ID=MMETSP1389-20130828/90222_1 /ASSEMBLY_ACC=CAM_ASM_000865 /TAXON_ID=302021 /ORGANISM="Rhodomonas sp., Strain CCMP768" /LENGTH=257 /DNA_ID=CAMNT_0049531469 /DNA_START=111 /DNA_END=884 /DNA_ORIENTATION=-